MRWMHTWGPHVCIHFPLQVAIIHTSSLVYLATLSKPFACNVPSCIPSPPLSHFLHQLQTSITHHFLKLEHFLRQFLKNRSHDRSAHTIRSSLQILEVPQNGVLKKLAWMKAHIWPMFCIYNFVILYTKKGVMGIQNYIIMSVRQFLAILAIKMANFLKLSYVPKKSVRAQTKKKDKSKKYWSTRRYSNISWTCLFVQSQMVMSGTETEVDWGVLQGGI